MSRRGGRDDFETRLRAAERQTQQRQVASVRVQQGNASLEDYRTFARAYIQSLWTLIVPTLFVVRGQRLLGLPGAPEAAPEFDLLRHVLSHQPDEVLASHLREGLARMDEVLSDAQVDAFDRVKAAVVRLMVGPGDGLPVRRRLWASGYVESEAARTCADYERAHIRELLDWTPWIDFGHRLLLEQGVPAEEADRTKVLLPLTAVGHALLDGIWFEL